MIDIAISNIIISIFIFFFLVLDFRPIIPEEEGKKKKKNQS